MEDGLIEIQYHDEFPLTPYDVTVLMICINTYLIISMESLLIVSWSSYHCGKQLLSSSFVTTTDWLQ
jgi:hypothetical protein